jgi:hypothetical protein
MTNMWQVYTRPTSASDFFGIKRENLQKKKIFASETNTFHISYVESKNRVKMDSNLLGTIKNGKFGELYINLRLV